MPIKYNTNFDFAIYMDNSDSLSSLREQFNFPVHNTNNAIYFCGNSLGLQPKKVNELMNVELANWAKYGVEGHFKSANPWFSYHHLFSQRLANIVGAKPNEVIAMNSLTVNLHLLMISFYRPKGKRYKIIMEAGAFPSDQYAIETQVRIHGYDPKDAIIEISPKPDNHLINDEDIIKAITQAGDSLAMVMFGGVNYYTGQYFNLKNITEAAHNVGAYAGFDLAHAVGNIPLHLHDWNVDFACWCTYKYLNAGPGAVGGAFVHENHINNPDILRLAGWWGNKEETRFKMEKGFIPQLSAASWQMSNAPVFNMVALNASLSIFDKTNMQKLREKSLLLTGYIEYLLLQLNNTDFEIITPSEPNSRGCQLSLLFKKNGKKYFEALNKNGIITDWREPNVIRIAPTPLYNTFSDCYRLYEVLEKMQLA